MTEQEAIKILSEVGAIISDSHFVYASGRHGRVYINKDAIYPDSELTSRLCRVIAQHFGDDQYAVEMVIAPAIGGLDLKTWVSYHLTQLTGRKVLGIYADKAPDGQAFIIKRGYKKILWGKRVLVVDDVLTTGRSVKKLIEIVEACGGKVIGLGVICNRGGISHKDMSVPEIFALVNLWLESWDEKDCPLCTQGIPINPELGHGK